MIQEVMEMLKISSCQFLGRVKEIWKTYKLYLK